MAFQKKILSILAFSLCYVAAAEAKKTPRVCQDMKLLSKVAKETIQYAMEHDTDDSVSDYLVLSGEDPKLEAQNKDGKDQWSVPVVVDGDGCYGNVDIEVETGTCKVVGAPSFTGVSCTDE